MESEYRRKALPHPPSAIMLCYCFVVVEWTEKWTIHRLFAITTREAFNHSLN